MERKLILFDEMGVKSVPDCGYSGRCYKMLLASIKVELQGLKKKTPKRLLLFHTGHVLVVCRIFSLKKYIHMYIFLLTFFDIHTCTDKGFFHLCVLFSRP